MEIWFDSGRMDPDPQPARFSGVSNAIVDQFSGMGRRLRQCNTLSTISFVITFTYLAKCRNQSYASEEVE
jgi:hypothetical protein